VHLRITATGRALTKSLMPRVIDFWNEALEEFSPAEAQQLIALLTRLLARIEARTLETRKQARAAK
jgi:DNA-binding MarR family transcriptional regulator